MLRKSNIDSEILKIRSINMINVLQFVSYEIWMNIFTFIPNCLDSYHLMLTCQLFKEIFNLNIIWMPILKN